jgi:hypothetical protein
LVWVGCVVLLLRGGSGLLDDVTRATGALPNGITGLSMKATTGHDHLRWADWTIDAYFLAGGIIFWLLATLNRKQPTRPRSRRGPGPAEGRLPGNDFVGVAESAGAEAFRGTPRPSNPSRSGWCPSGQAFAG